MRSVAATTVWLVAVVAALVLALGALLVVLDVDRGNALVSFVVDTAARLDLGTLVAVDPGSTAQSAHDALVRSVLVNWGTAALAYLVVGKVLDRLLRP